MEGANIRNIWGLLRKFGDAEIAGLVAPRALIIEASKGPEISGSPTPDKIHKNVAAPGRIISPPLALVLNEAEKAKKIYKGLSALDNFKVIVNKEGNGP